VCVCVCVVAEQPSPRLQICYEVGAAKQEVRDLLDRIIIPPVGSPGKAGLVATILLQAKKLWILSDEEGDPDLMRAVAAKIAQLKAVC